VRLAANLGVSLPQQKRRPVAPLCTPPLNRLTLPGLPATADCSYACEAHADRAKYVRPKGTGSSGHIWAGFFRDDHVGHGLTRHRAQASKQGRQNKLP
jgi:hypothetical protein